MIANVALLKPVSPPKPTFAPEAAPAPTVGSPGASGSRFTEVLSRAEKSATAKVDRKAHDTPVEKPRVKEGEKKRKEDPDVEAGAGEDGATTQALVEGGDVDDGAVTPEEDAEETAAEDAVLVTVPVPATSSEEVVAQGDGEQLTQTTGVPVVPSLQASMPDQGNTNTEKATPSKQTDNATAPLVPQQAVDAAVDPIATSTESESASDGDASLEAQPRTADDDATNADTDVPQTAARIKLDLLPQPSSSSSAPSQVAVPAPTPPQVSAASFAHAAPAQPLPTPETDSPQDQAVLARVVRGMQGALNQQGGSVTLRLTPPELGTVRIELAFTQGSVAARFHTETESVRQLLTEQLSHLRTGLERQGLHVERLAVQTQAAMPTHDSQQSSSGGGGDGRSRGEYTSSQDQRNGGARQDASDQPPQRRFERELLNAVA